MDEQGYNGWKNYETWAVGLWLGNDEQSYNLTREMADGSRQVAPALPQVVDGIWTVEEAMRFNLADLLKYHVEEVIMPDLGASLASDLLGAALSEVDWYDLAENLLSETSDAAT